MCAVSSSGLFSVRSKLLQVGRVLPRLPFRALKRSHLLHSNTSLKLKRCCGTNTLRSRLICLLDQTTDIPTILSLLSSSVRARPPTTVAKATPQLQPSNCTLYGCDNNPLLQHGATQHAVSPIFFFSALPRLCAITIKFLPG